MVNLNQTLFIIQDVGRCDNNAKIIKALEEMNQPFITIGNIPFTNVYTNFTQENVIKILSHNKFICFSGIKMLRQFCPIFTATPKLVNEYHDPLAEEVQEILRDKIGSGYWYSLYGFNQNVYGSDPNFFLNAYADYFLLSELREGVTFSEDKFIKPASDLKWFNADILNKGQTINDLLAGQTTMSEIHDDSFDTTVMVANVKNISNMIEVRTFVVDKQIVTGSFYGANHRKGTADVFSAVVSWGTTFLQERCFLPAHAFTLDMCYNLDTQEIKIVEYNCLNCSGVYNSNLHVLIDSIIW